MKGEISEERTERSVLITGNAQRRVSFNDKKKPALDEETNGMTDEKKAAFDEEESLHSQNLEILNPNPELPHPELPHPQT
jgi:hypothetical protein